MREYLTTGQAARLCSVTPDAVLKWIKSGKVKAHRTPGGHYRIHRKNLEHMLAPGAKYTRQRWGVSKPFRYCWEYNAVNDDVKTECLECLVYKSRARRCYEMVSLPVGSGHARIFCDGTCDTCEYFQLVNAEKLNVLIIASDVAIKTDFERLGGELDYNVEFAESEYQMASVMEKFRADFVVLDSSLFSGRLEQVCGDVATDPRIPSVRIILVGDRRQIPKGCNRDVFAVVKKPLRRVILDKLLMTLQDDEEMESKVA